MRSRARSLLTIPLLLGNLAVVRAAAAGPFAYVANHGDGTVSVLDTATNGVVATVTVGSEPLGAAVLPAETRVYVANQVTPNGTVSVIDTAGNAVVATVDVGSGPSGVAVKLPGDRVYVTNRDDKTVSVIDTATNAVSATIPVGNNPLGIAVDPAGNPAYVVNKGSNAVSVIDTVTNAVVATIAVGNDPSQIALSPNGARAYVSNSSNASVSVIDTGLNGVVATVPVGNIPEGLAVDPTGARLYVANSGPNSVSVVDTASNAVIATIPVGSTPFDLAVRPDGARLFVANRAGGSVSVIDTATNAVSATVPVGLNPAGLGDFIVPALRIPSFAKAARKCQGVLLRQAVKLVKLHHGLEAVCRLGLRKAEAGGKGTAAAQAACLRALDLGNPASKLALARAKLGAAVLRGCQSVLPRQIDGPCDRGVGDFGSTVDCLLAQHATRVTAIADDELSAIHPTPLGKPALACQTAIAKAGRRFTDRLHKDLGVCVEKILTGAGDAKAEAKAIARCLATSDLANPGSKAGRARDAAVLAIGKGCVGVAPADLGSPCNGSASTVAETASCIVQDHAADVARLVAAEVNGACTILTRIGLATSFPAACFGVQ